MQPLHAYLYLFFKFLIKSMWSVFGLVQKFAILFIKSQIFFSFPVIFWIQHKTIKRNEKILKRKKIDSIFHLPASISIWQNYNKAIIFVKLSSCEMIRGRISEIRECLANQSEFYFPTQTIFFLCFIYCIRLFLMIW